MDRENQQDQEISGSAVPLSPETRQARSRDLEAWRVDLSLLRADLEHRW